jgi:hypothetical protein
MKTQSMTFVWLNKTRSVVTAGKSAAKNWIFRRLDDDRCGILKDRRDSSDKTLSQTHVSL